MHKHETYFSYPVFVGCSVVFALASTFPNVCARYRSFLKGEGSDRHADDSRG